MSWSAHSAIGAKLFTARSNSQMKAARMESRRWYWPAPAAMNLHRFGPSARIPTPLRDPFLTGVSRPTAQRSTTRAVARVEQGRSSQAVADHFTIRGRSLKHPVAIVRASVGRRRGICSQKSARQGERLNVRGASLEPKRVTIVMKVREVLEVYHAHPPVGRFPFSLLPFGRRTWIRRFPRPRRATCQKNSAAECPNPFSAHCPNRDVGVFPVWLRGRAHQGPERDLIGA